MSSKQHIIETALKLFLQKGFKEVTMKELVAEAGLTKGAFYHYFRSKEQVFEEVALRFFNEIKITDYDHLSTTSLHEFYTNWLQSFFNSKVLDDTKDFKSNHYYLIFDGIRLVPAFKEIFDKQIEKEEKAWVKIISIAQESGEIKSTLTSKQIAQLFIYASDGLVADLILQNKTALLKKEAAALWDNIYALLKA